MNGATSRLSAIARDTSNRGLKSILLTTKMKSYQVFAAVVVLHLANGFPMKLLRVPKIYNALITTNQKLLPSEAFPASTGPAFQPIGLSGNPVLLNPEDFEKREESTPLEGGDAPRPFSKMPTPLTFYPRYNVYHQLPQSVFPYHNVYQPPPIVVPVQRSQPSQPAAEAPIEELSQPTTEEAPKPEFGFVTNNSPSNLDIPNVPPPLPPIGAPKPQAQISP